MSSKLIRRDITKEIIGCAIEVHKVLGPGFLEKFYEEALCIELSLRGLRFERQPAISLTYRGREVGYHRLDLVVERYVIVELKAVKKLEDIHFATTLSYLKAAKAEVALLLNFNTSTLSIKRFANTILKLNAESRKGGNAEDLLSFFREGENSPITHLN